MASSHDRFLNGPNRPDDEVELIFKLVELLEEGNENLSKPIMFGFG